jgi:hypothetical protein
VAPSTRPAIVLGGASLCATLAVLVAGSQQPDCSFFDWMFPAILALQLCFALGAGFATGYRHPGNRNPINAGLATSLAASLSGLIFFGFSLTGVLPTSCGSYGGLAVLFVSLILVFIIAPVAIAGGAAAGWVGGLFARLKRGRIALAGTLVPGLALGLLLLLHQPFNSGIRGIVNVPFCSSYPTTRCVLQPSRALITVNMPHSEQLVTMTSSDDRGRYQIGLKPGKYEISAGQYGFSTGRIPITISANSYLTLELDAK